MPAQRKYIFLQTTRSASIGLSSGKSSLGAGMERCRLNFSGVTCLGKEDITMTGLRGTRLGTRVLSRGRGNGGGFHLYSVQHFPRVRGERKEDGCSYWLAASMTQPLTLRTCNNKGCDGNAEIVFTLLALGPRRRRIHSAPMILCSVGMFLCGDGEMRLFFPERNVKGGFVRTLL